MWLVSLNPATLRSAGFGFFGVVVQTRVQTPRRWGLPLSAGVLFLATLSWRPFRTSCWIVGTASPSSLIFGRPAAHVVLHLAAPAASGYPGWPLEAAQAGGRTHLACKFARLSDPRSRACRRHHSAPAREGRYVRVGKPARAAVRCSRPSDQGTAARQRARARQ